jgi:hypothetical protein
MRTALSRNPELFSGGKADICGKKGQFSGPPTSEIENKKALLWAPADGN